MKKIVSLLCLSLAFYTALAQRGLLAIQQTKIKELAAARHIQPKPIEDLFSTQFFSLYLQHLDEHHLFFTVADLATLEPFKKTIDDDWNSGTIAFFTASANLYKARLQAAQARVTEICARPFDFSLPDIYDVIDTSVSTTDKVLATRWYKLLKWDVLHALTNAAANQWHAKKAIIKAEVLAREPEMRARTKTKYLNLIANSLGTDADFLKECTAGYLNTFVLWLDPHSAFFDAQARQDFQAGLNTEGYFFGLSLSENERGEVYISRLAPGGAAWASGLLNKGDIVVQLKWEGSAAVDLAGLDAADVSALFDLHTKGKMELVVRKGNGQQQPVVMQKQKVENEDNIVKSFVLAGEQNIGYIMLPSFYTEWEDKTGSRCAADVAREIVKLKKDSMAGLILDLRFNGGGSMAEAVEMAGIFIDEGAICQIKTKEAKVEVLKDMNRGVIYNGPLLVLVNGQSASASELLAASLQDYNRAIIAGTPTYGKATGQDIMPLQTGGDGSTGFAKLTMLKLYRPTGKSAQKQGVRPDVVLPDIYGLDGGEAAEPYVLAADTVAAYKYFKPMAPLKLQGLQQKSNSRVAASEKFKEGELLKQTTAVYKNKKSISLKWDDVEKEIKSYLPRDKEKIFMQPATAYSVRNNKADQTVPLIAATELNAFWLKRLAADMYVEEAFRIVTDFIQLH